MALAQGPLWLASHLPLKGGDRLLAYLPVLFNVRDIGTQHHVVGMDVCAYLISPLEGEMVGRPEGGKLAQVYLAIPPSRAAT
ncbi:lytic murein transglycosylase [Agrobacterium vitis]|uniref:Lytic murein transglycosylase n=1 Tax=Agrobacterium vitis TaxID=373 RepID=A0A368NFF4_AGRVI|nr:lytic murein transglycosylase [Agrobacterium vitis]KAA3521981.1 lytic murein transglycosylase [Agrobacterium vitis]MCE6077810.1 lytic murein transglycosylase [Agrobacterium vitis]MCF1469420.1 lytic murein transglycosylase [Agrobacterium vitis]MCF1479909.1 lytic murein transglycosylase [Agrobacterium vitis]